MNLLEFRAEVYKKLGTPIEKDGTLFYPEPAVIATMEWLFENFENIEIVDLDVKIAETIDRAFKKLEG